MKTNNKRLGNSFERRIAKLLSLKISNGANDKIFWRTPASGAIGKTADKYKGDLMVIDETGEYKWFDFIVECKTSNKGSIIPLRSSVAEYLRQCEKQYSNNNWLIVLQIRGSGGDIYVITRSEFSKKIDGKVIATFNYRGNEYFAYDFFEINFIK